MNITLNKSFFINDITMFLIGAILGTSMHIVLQHIVKRYQIESDTMITLLGILQLSLISVLVKFLVKFTQIYGFLLMGILTSQDILLFSVYPKNRQHNKPYQAKKVASENIYF